MSERTKYKVLMIGAGGMARVWIRYFLPSFSERLEIIGLVDIVPEVLAEQGEFLGLLPHYRFLSIHDAFDAVRQGRIKPDICIVVVPPHVHREAIEQAAALNIDVLSEKPIADSWESCVEIYKAVKKSNIKMQVVQNYRHTPWIIQAKQVLSESHLGQINYIVARFTSDYRIRNSWGAPFRHQIPHALLVEGGVHHLDQLRNLTGDDFLSISGTDWRPAFSAESFDGECCALFVGRMQLGAVAVYEGSCIAAGAINSWNDEMFRLECERGSIVIRKDTITRIVNQRSEIIPVQSGALEWEGHYRAIDTFFNWLDGSSPPTTVIDDNIKTAAVVFAAIRASETQSVVKVEDFLCQLPSQAL